MSWFKSLERLQHVQQALALVAGVALTLTGFYLLGDYLSNNH